MAQISDDIKVYIVTALACYDSTTQVARDVKEKFGVQVSHQQVSAYDPSTVNGERLSKKYKDLFAQTREKFKADTSDIPIAQSAYRLRVLDRLARAAEGHRNVAMVAQLLEQAAKETGGAYTNRHKHEHTGRDGGPIQTMLMRMGKSSLPVARRRHRA